MRSTGTEEKPWYVCIRKGAAGYSSFSAVGSNNYRTYKKDAKKHGVEIVAECFDVSSDTLDRMSGFDSGGGRTENNHLKELVDRLNQEEGFDAQEELSKLCES